MSLECGARREREKKADRSPSHMTIALRGGSKTPKAEIESETALISVMRFRIKGKQGSHSQKILLTS